MSIPRMAWLALAAALALMVPAPASAHARAAIGVSYFYDSLSPYGEWIVNAQFGYVWRPSGLYAGWRPYSDGGWIYTDFGWTFVSDEPWGWAAYHYGRWYFDPYWGWVWVPGTAWAPAWVVFYQGGGYVGWAPMAPAVRWSVVVGGGYRIDPRGYCFVEERHFAAPQLRRRLLAPARHRALLGATANVTRYARSGDIYVNRSLSTERIAHASRRTIAPRPLGDLTGPGRGPNDGAQVALFRPRVSAQVSHPPREVVRRDTARGGRNVREPRAQSATAATSERTRLESRRPASGSRATVPSRPAPSRPGAEVQGSSSPRRATGAAAKKPMAKAAPNQRQRPRNPGGG